MKRTFAILAMLLSLTAVRSQQAYWVLLTDKAGTTFDPYAYFDAKAIERYAQCGADLHDVSNYPLNASYVQAVGALATEEVGCSRWMNAVGVVATPAQAEAIARLACVQRVVPIEGNLQLASSAPAASPAEDPFDTTLAQQQTVQVMRMQGDLFRQAGIDGKGVRIAVFDGGFPKVNTHEAFRHLREGKQILKTWNFPNRKEDVYGWNSHGTMTLSCIAGRWKGRDLGLATGAEFLLARTEVEAEPFKEEIWWQQAVEWADRNGANIISSSLGYGKDRYYTRDMDGTSYVARAANMAARKGMLVVNSAGNEADDRSWQYIITPSDADSVLCIGGITHSLRDYEHISFASFGPSADGRQKPNLCAIAHVTAASPKGTSAYDDVYGTSFSCPLVAGFAACAWQASKGKTNMQMFDLLQRSGDLYPYCDYAFGYGVPQASFFVGPKAAGPAAPTFRFEPLSATEVCVVPLFADTNVHIFYKDVADDGSILVYGKRTLSPFDSTQNLDFRGGHRLVVACRGYVADYRFERPTTVEDKHSWVRVNRTVKQRGYATTDNLVRAPAQDIARERRSEWDFYGQLGLPVALEANELSARFWSPAKRFGVRWQHHFSKAYGLGLGLEWGSTCYRYNDRALNDLERGLGLDEAILGGQRITKRKAYLGELAVEFFQRVRLTPGGQLHKGLHWDLGLYGSWGYTSYRLRQDLPAEAAATASDMTLYDPSPLANAYRWNYGLATRLGYDIIGLYARYRLNDLGAPVPDGQVRLPRLEVGLQLLF